ncbi:uncharacterized protein LOC115219491 [Argonauta hians]
MPQRKSAESLKKQCLHIIALHMDNVFQVGSRPCFYEFESFGCLTAEMTQDLINTLSEQRLLKCHHLQMLICTRLKHLDLGACAAVANYDSVVRKIAERCQTLTKLNLSSLNNISPKILVDLIKSIPQIQSLVLKNTKCNDQVMCVIGQTCCQLRELNVYGCCQITDLGAYGLCKKNNCVGGVPNCSQLVSLDINSTAVSLNGASNILENLHNLKYFQYCDVFSVFEKIYQNRIPFGSSQNRAYRNQRLAVNDSSGAGSSEGIEGDFASQLNIASTSEEANQNQDRGEDSSENVIDASASNTGVSKTFNLDSNRDQRKFCINTLTATGLKCTVTAQSIKIACEVCPYVTEVYLYLNIGNKGIAHLTQLSQLHVLEVVSCAPDAVTFEEGLVPVLQKCGLTLSRLTLYDFSAIDIISIGQHCPRLHHLTLESSSCDYYTARCSSHGSEDGDEHSRCQDTNNRVDLFAHIKSLKIKSDSHNFSADVLRLILINAKNLNHLYLTNMQFLTYDWLRPILSDNPLRFLQTLILEMCNGVDRKFVMSLLADQQNGLQRLDLIECQSIKRGDYEYFLDRIQQDNVDVNITWM